MIKLSTGEDSTLENWIKLTSAVFGVDSPAVTYLCQKAQKEPEGVKAEVLADERQLLLVLANIHFGGVNQ